MKKDIVKKVMFLVVLGLFFSVQSVSAQVIDSRNKVEYMPEDTENYADDLNSLSVQSAKKRTTGAPIKRMKKKAKSKRATISMDDLKKLSNLRFRKKRGLASEKCVKQVKDDCNAAEEKKKQLEKIKNQ